MRQSWPLMPAIVAAGLFAAAAVAGPMIAAGAILGAGLAAAIYMRPVFGLGLMLLSGTALQILGSAHIIGAPVSLNKIAGAATVGVWAVRSILLRVPLTWSPQMPALFGFILAVWASSFVSPDPAESMEGLFRYIQLALLTFMIANIAGESERALDVSLIVLTASMGLSAIIGLMEFFLPGMSIESDDPSLVQGNIGAIIDRDSLDGVEVKRITGGLSESNWFSYTLAAVVPINLYLFHRFPTHGARLVILAVSALQCVGIVLSFTRSAMIAIAVTTIYLVIRGRLPVKPLLLACMIGAAGFIAWNPAGLERVYSIAYAQQGSTPHRVYLLLGGVALVQERPIIGFGYNQYGPNFHRWLLTVHELPEYVEHWERALEDRVASGEERFEWIMPHNTVLQVWVEFGLLGLLSFAAFYVLMLNDLHQARLYGDPLRQLLAECLMASALGFLVCALFGHLALAKIIWMLAGFAAALRRVAIAPQASATALVPGHATP